jgi:transposase
MGIVRQLQHWLGGKGPRLVVADFVPEDHPLRLWSDTFPWAPMVEAVDQDQDPPSAEKSPRGRPGISTRVLLALELLKAELSCSDEQICSRLRTDFAVMYACGIESVHADPRQSHFVFPEILAQFRGRFSEELMPRLLQIQTTAAMEAGLISPSHLVVDTFASEQGSQRVTDATTLYKAKKKS